MKKLLLLATCVALTFACSGAGNNAAGSNGATGAATTNGAAAGGNVAGGSTSTGGVTGGTTNAGVTMQPGQWEFTATVTDFDVPGAPPAQLEKMKEAMAGGQGTRTQSQCLTQADVSNIAERMAQQGSQGGQCTFARQTFGGGNIDVAGTCRSPQGNVEMAITGNYTETTSQMALNINLSGGAQQMRMSSTIAGRRTGDCPG